MFMQACTIINKCRTNKKFFSGVNLSHECYSEGWGENPGCGLERCLLLMTQNGVACAFGSASLHVLEGSPMSEVVMAVMWQTVQFV